MARDIPNTVQQRRIVLLLILFLSTGGLSPVFGANSPGSPVGPYQGFGYEWENNNLGMGRQVPPPWTPVKVQEKTLEVWGRNYLFTEALFPRQITSQGQELLASPMRLRLKAGGEKISDKQAGTRVTDSSHEDQVQLMGKLQNGKVDVQLQTTLEFDGFLKFDLTIAPKNSAVSLEELVVEIPFHSQVARFYNRFLEYDFVRERIDREDLLDSAGRISRPLDMSFTHTLWIGNHRIGAEFSAETNQEWSNRNLERAIEIMPGAADTLFRLNLVDEPIKIQQATLYSFGLYITPIRPMNRNWRTFIMGEPMQHYFRHPPGYNPQLWTFCAPSTRMRTFPVEYIGLPIPPRSPQQRAKYDHVLAKAKENGVCVVPYSALMFMHRDVPEFESYRKYWLSNLDSLGKKTRDTFQIGLYSKSIQDFLIWVYVQAATQWNHDGLYFDIAVGWNNVTNPFASRLVPHKRKLYQPIFAVREFHKRLYKAVKTRRPNFLLTQHHAKTPVLFSGFSDIVYSGEAMNIPFREVGQRMKQAGQLAADYLPYAPDYSLVPDDFWLAVYGSNLGFGQYFLPQVQKWNPIWDGAVVEKRGTGKRQEKIFQRSSRKDDEDIEDRDQGRKIRDKDRYTRFMLSRTMVLDLPAMRLRLDMDVFDKVILGLEKFGGLMDPLIFIGPQEASRFRVNPENSRLLTSAYLRPRAKKMVVIVANWTSGKVAETIDFNFNNTETGITKISKVTDLEGGTPPLYNVHSLQINLPGNDFRVLMIE